MYAAAPRVFGLWSGLGCGLGFAFKKILGEPSIFSLGSISSTLGNLPRGSLHKLPPWLSYRLSQSCSFQRIILKIKTTCFAVEFFSKMLNHLIPFLSTGLFKMSLKLRVYAFGEYSSRFFKIKCRYMYNQVYCRVKHYCAGTLIRSWSRPEQRQLST